MIDLYLAPKRYVQAKGILLRAGEYIKGHTQRPLILGDALVLSIVRSLLEEKLLEVDVAPLFVLFGEECSQPEVERVTEIAHKERTDCVIGVGGGKALDTARLVSGQATQPLITIPTSAATCSAASSMAVIYESGIRRENITGKGADLVLVDSSIISRGPSRLLAAGMGDALAKWYEGKPTFEQMKDPDSGIRSAMNLSTLIKETILSFGLKAKRDVDAKKESTAVEAIIEANVLLTGVVSGLGGAKFRAAVAHALLYGLSAHAETRRYLHGEVVAYGIIVQLCLERKIDELNSLLPFFSELGLPLSLREVGIKDPQDPLLWKGLERTCAEGSTAHNMPFPVSAPGLYQALMETEERVKKFREKVLDVGREMSPKERGSRNEDHRS